MTEPRTPDSDIALAPVRRRVAPAPSLDASDQLDLLRGTCDALVGALGRMQLRLDVMALEQSESLGRIEGLLRALLEPDELGPDDASDDERDDAP